MMIIRKMVMMIITAMVIIIRAKMKRIMMMS